VSTEEVNRIVMEILHGHEPVALPYQPRLGIDEPRGCAAGDWEGEIFAGHLAGLLDAGLEQRGLAIVRAG
jgi:hypothetical protein